MKTILYRNGSHLYINATNYCSNECVFCIRCGRNGVYDSELWLDEEPTADEVLQEIKNYSDMKNVSEVVFCGFGEPTYRIDVITLVGKYLKSIGKKVRINTNGQANLINGKDVSTLIAESVDTVNVSLNASNAKEYQKICQSAFGEKAFDELLDFAVKCNNCGVKVVLSIVDCVGEQEIENCKKLANELKIELRVRTFE